MSFNQIIGQDLAKTILKNALVQQRLSHAYLFTGEEGLGKDSTAFEFTKAINCQENDNDSCNHCISCRKANNKNHPDIKEIYPDGAFIKIDQIRKLQQEILYKPYESKKKVYIIHQADKMNTQAANSLLKTLEEPPSYAIIILITNNLNKLLPTIISRCQLIRFQLVADDIIKDSLIQDYDVSEEEATLFTTLAGGRYRFALEWVENIDKVEERREILKIANSLKDLTRIESFEFVQKLLDERDKVNLILDMILTWYRDLLMVKLGQNKNLINIDYYNKLSDEAKEWRVEGIEAIIRLIEDSSNIINNLNVNLQLALEVLFLRLNKLRRKNYAASNRSYI
ncbi:DNA polymerase III delta prime subunit [Orenia metallireducens]|jgi:DNA polymerase-3 subunit delta'|uniref:DNA polymerase III subunit delta' n=1 Tax=Orenia metallireducens TaxID=1413210 RepID=A0A285GZC6_9FIRM|nr:DNA polymerase III subunit delta' [Orenia metallireducens]PRX26444.1 DNA polymerase III delta prime subunit [Orenia metallireducens]SNY28664.1 DNA polymerase III, delta prime subunit [Orenia metallireducens]